MPEEGFSIRVILMDMEFDKVVEKIPTVEVNITAAQEHMDMGGIEHGVHLIK